MSKFPDSKKGGHEGTAPKMIPNGANRSDGGGAKDLSKAAKSINCGNRKGGLKPQ